jgi:hypothetical protein
MSDIAKFEAKLNSINTTVAKIDRKVESLDNIVRGGDNPQDSLIALVHSTQKLINTIRNVFWGHLFALIIGIFYIGGEWFQFKATIAQAKENRENIKTIDNRVDILEIKYKGFTR